MNSVLSQTYRSLEVIIVDDASNDDLFETVDSIASPFAVTILRNVENLGPSASRNVGIDAARGRFIAFLDSDDEWLPRKLERQARALLASPDPDRAIAIAETWEKRPDAIRRTPRWRPEDMPLGDYFFLASGTMQTSSLVVGAELARQVRFDTRLRQFEDYLFLLQAERAGACFRFQDEKLFFWVRDFSAKDNLTASVNYRSGKHFLTSADSLLSEDAKLSFSVRHFAPALVRREPLQFSRLLMSAARRGLIRPRQLPGIFRRCLRLKIS